MPALVGARRALLASQAFSPRALPGLKLWLDARSLGLTDGAQVAAWPNLADPTNVPSNATSAQQPVYQANALGGVPGVLFDGTDDFLSYDGTFFAGTLFTIIAIWGKLPASPNDCYLIGGTAGSTNADLQLGYRSNTDITFAYYANDLDIGVTSVPTASLELLTAQQNATGRIVRRMGVPYGSDSNTTLLVSNAGSSIGKYIANGTLFSGLCCALLVWTAALSTADIQRAELWLARQYGLSIP